MPPPALLGAAAARRARCAVPRGGSNGPAWSAPVSSWRRGANYGRFNCSSATRRPPSWNYRGCWHQTLPSAPRRGLWARLARALPVAASRARIGQVPRLLPSLDVRAVSQARSPESNPDSPPGVGPSARRDRADRVMPRKPGRAVAASRCSPAGARPCAHVLAPGCQRCPASRDRRGGCNRCPEPSAASRVRGHAWLVSLGRASDSGRIDRMAGRGRRGLRAALRGGRRGARGPPPRGGLRVGGSPIVWDRRRSTHGGRSPPAPRFFGFPWGLLTRFKKPAPARQSTLSYIVRDRRRGPYGGESPPIPRFFESPWGLPRDPPGGPPEA